MRWCCGGWALWLERQRAEGGSDWVGPLPDPSVWLHGVVAEDRRHAVFAVVQLASSAEVIPARLRLPGLDPAASYLVRPCAELPPPEAGATAQPSWLSGESVTLPGRVLATVGLPAPLLQPAQAAVFEAAAPPA